MSTHTHARTNMHTRTHTHTYAPELERGFVAWKIWNFQSKFLNEQSHACVTDCRKCFQWKEWQKFVACACVCVCVHMSVRVRECVCVRWHARSRERERESERESSGGVWRIGQNVKYVERCSRRIWKKRTKFLQRLFASSKFYLSGWFTILFTPLVTLRT